MFALCPDPGKAAAAQIAATLLALQSWADVANIRFVRVDDGNGYSDNATLLFSNYSQGASGAAAFAYLPVPGATAGNQLQGDSFYNASKEVPERFGQQEGSL